MIQDYVALLTPPRGANGKTRQWNGLAESWDDACEKAEHANPGWHVHTAGPVPPRDPAKVTCSRCGEDVLLTGDRYFDGGALIDHMEAEHTPHAVALRPIPETPSDGDLWDWYAWAAGAEGYDPLPPGLALLVGLRAVWRAGCDTGMVAPVSTSSSMRSDSDG